MPRLTAGTRSTATNRQTIQNGTASLVFNGTSSYVTIPNAAQISGLSALTILTTFKLNGIGGAAATLFTKRVDGNNRIEITVAANGRLYSSIGTGTSAEVISNQTLQKDVWYTNVTTYDGANINSYIGGATVNTAVAQTGAVTDGTADVLIGQRGGGLFLKGIVKQVTVWNRALTSSEITAVTFNGSTPSGVVANYPLNEGAGTVAYDTSGNGNNGTITSGTWTRDTPTKTRKLVNNNLVYNGDFEIAPVANVAQTGNYAWINGTVSGTSSTTEPIFGWFKYSYGGTQSAMIDTSELLNGKPSLKLSTTATNSYVGMTINSLDATYHKLNNIPCLPSTSYAASVWVKTNVTSGTATTGVRANISQLTGTGINSAGAGLTLVTGLVTSIGWTKYEGTFTTSATARFLTPELRIVGNDGAATLIADAWFADIQLYPTTPITRSAVV